jgi:F-type H+-transporting ATPase subunit c
MYESYKLIGAGLSTIGLTGAAIGAGIIFGNLVSATARNPSLKSELFSLAILGFSLTEAVGLFSLMMSFLILFAL